MALVKLLPSLGLTFPSGNGEDWKWWFLMWEEWMVEGYKMPEGKQGWMGQQEGGAVAGGPQQNGVMVLGG